MKKFTFCLASSASFVAMGFALCAFWGCSSENGKIAGGVSEETNTVAGILTDGKGNPVKGAVILARHTVMDSVEFVDTTSTEGAFAFPITRHGSYGLSAKRDSFAYYDAVEYSGADLNIEAKLQPVSDISARFVLDELPELSGIEIRIPGSDWRAATDSAGRFELLQVPEGDFSLMVKSPVQNRYANAKFALSLGKDGFALNGPLPLEMETDSLEDSIVGSSADEHETTLTLPLSAEFGLLSWWPMDNVTAYNGDSVTTDARSRLGSVKIYGGATQTKGTVSKALHFENATQFGVIEDDHNLLDSLTELTLEAFIKFDSFVANKNSDSTDKVWQKNVLGKLGFGSPDDRNVFSLALINGVCHVENPTLSFFISKDGGEFSCENAVVSEAELKENEWIHVIVTWKDGVASIYQYGKLAGSGNVGVEMLVPSDEPIFFGKENLDFELDDVRLGARAITSVDVLYRYYQKTGGQL